MEWHIPKNIFKCEDRGGIPKSGFEFKAYRWQRSKVTFLAVIFFNKSMQHPLEKKVVHAIRKPCWAAAKI